MALSQEDSGVTLRMEEKQSDEIIKMLETKVMELQNVVEQYQKQLDDIKPEPKPSWIKNLVAENTRLKETVQRYSTEREELLKEHEKAKATIKSQQHTIDKLQRSSLQRDGGSRPPEKDSDRLSEDERGDEMEEENSIDQWETRDQPKEKIPSHAEEEGKINSMIASMELELDRMEELVLVEELQCLKEQEESMQETNVIPKRVTHRESILNLNRRERSGENNTGLSNNSAMVAELERMRGEADVMGAGLIKLQHKNEALRAMFLSSVENKNNTRRLAKGKLKRMTRKFNSLRRNLSVKDTKYRMEKVRREAMGEVNLNLRIQMDELTEKIEMFEEERAEWIQAIEAAKVLREKTSAIIDRNDCLEEEIGELKGIVYSQNEERNSMMKCNDDLQTEVWQNTDTCRHQASLLIEADAHAQKLSNEIEMGRERYFELEAENAKLNDVITKLQPPKRSWLKRWFRCSSN